LVDAVSNFGREQRFCRFAENPEDVLFVGGHAVPNTANSGALLLRNCFEAGVHRPHYLVGLSTEWTRDPLRYFFHSAQWPGNLERPLTFRAGYDLLHTCLTWLQLENRLEKILLAFPASLISFPRLALSGFRCGLKALAFAVRAITTFQFYASVATA
jgi:hypothetical protein